MPGYVDWENRFGLVLDRAGISYERCQSVRLVKPISLANGESKVVASLDFKVLGEQENTVCYADITKSMGNTDHKKAQIKVVRNAGKKIVIISSSMVQCLEGVESDESLRQFLFKIFSFE